MSDKQPSPTQSKLHPRNRNRARYDLAALTASMPSLKAYIIEAKSGEDTIDFAEPRAVKLLNQAILAHYYGVQHWDFSDHNLCPPIPGRADYLHYLADLLAQSEDGQIPKGKRIKIVDIGTGATCIYPIIGAIEYGWRFVASDTDPRTIKNAIAIVKANPKIKDNIFVQQQPNAQHILHNILNVDHPVTAMMCNPPFHASAKEAKAGRQRKNRNLTGSSEGVNRANFSGNHHELVYPGGEVKFIKTMISESETYAQTCMWFTTLVSKKDSLTPLQRALKKTDVEEVRIIPMGTGNKVTRILAWTYLDASQRASYGKD